MKIDDIRIPKYLWRDDRPVDNNFKDDEMLHRKVNSLKELILEDDKESWRVNIKAVSLEGKPRLSFNRNKYCKKPDDVLWNIRTNEYEDYKGIITVKYSVKKYIKEIINTDKKTSYTFNIEHIPEKYMYPHTELRIYKNNDISYSLSSNIIKTTLRYFLSYAEIYKLPRN